MSDLRNKMKRILDDERMDRQFQEQMARAQAQADAHPPPRCAVCGAENPWVVNYDRWRPTLFFCNPHLPDWAAYDLENDERKDRVCNLYSITKSQDAIRQLVKFTRDMTGNLPSMPAVFPNRMAPVVRAGADGVRELLVMRWGFPPPSILGSKSRNPYLTNVRNTDSRYWRTWLTKPEQRCLVPVTSFAEPDNNQGPKSIWTWFAQNESRPLMFFAGIWREWEGDRGTKAAPDVGKHLVFSFLTTDASPDVAPIHPDATPVLLLDEAAREEWMTAPWEIAQGLQRPPPAGALRVVAINTKQDDVAIFGPG
jgi:putative SOS response-associated peptidase YedK